MESILIERVRNGLLTCRRDDIDGLLNGDDVRKNRVGGPIPVPARRCERKDEGEEGITNGIRKRAAAAWYFCLRAGSVYALAILLTCAVKACS